RHTRFSRDWSSTCALPISPKPPMQSAKPCLYDGYIRCLRSLLYHHASPQQVVDFEARRFFRGKPNYIACFNHLVSENLRKREVLHVSPCHRIIEQKVCRRFYDTDLISRTRKLSVSIHGCVAGRRTRPVAGADSIDKNSFVTDDFATALLGDDGG